MEKSDGTRAAPLDLVPIILRPFSNQLLFAIIEFDGFLDKQRLNRAIAGLLIRHPILCSKLSADGSWPVWLPDDATPECELIHVYQNCSTAGIARYCATCSAPGSDQSIKLTVLRGSTRDTLCIRIDHTVADGAGVKTMAYQLARLYRLNVQPNSQAAMSPDTPRPEVCIAWDKLKLAQKFRSLSRKPYTPAGWHFEIQPAVEQQHASTSYLIRELELPGKAVGGRRNGNNGPSINDRLLCYLHRALIRSNHAQVLRHAAIQFTVDLRRYVSHQPTLLANLSGTESVTLDGMENTNTGELLTNISRQTSRIKRCYPGIASAKVTEWLIRRNYTACQQRLRAAISASSSAGLANPILTNFGSISSQLLHFGQPAICNAYIVCPSLLTPGIMLGASSFGAKLTLSSGFAAIAGSSNLHAEVMNGLMREHLATCH